MICQSNSVVGLQNGFIIATLYVGKGLYIVAGEKDAFKIVKFCCCDILSFFMSLGKDSKNLHLKNVFTLYVEKNLYNDVGR